MMLVGEQVWPSARKFSLNVPYQGHLGKICHVLTLFYTLHSLHEYLLQRWHGQDFYVYKFHFYSLETQEHSNLSSYTNSYPRVDVHLVG